MPDVACDCLYLVFGSSKVQHDMQRYCCASVHVGVCVHVFPTEWTNLQVDEEALQVATMSLRHVASLVQVLISGDVTFRDVQTTLKHTEQFNKIYRQCMSLPHTHSTTVTFPLDIF